MKIISLETENFKRVRVVRIDATNQHAIVLAGENEQGKSSVLDSIESAMRGKAVYPPVPVHDDADKSRIVIDLGDYKVIRTITPGGGGTLTLSAPNGTVYKSPQAVLEKLWGDLTFDPMAFEALKGAEQAALLRQLAGVDTTTLDQAITERREERHAIIRDTKLTEKAMEESETFPDVGVDLISPEEIASKLTRADALENSVRSAEISANRAADAFERAAKDVAAAQAAFEAAEKALTAAKARGNEIALAQFNANNAYEQAMRDAPDREAMRAEVSAAAEHNRRVHANIRRQQIERHLEGQRAQAAKLHQEVDLLEVQRNDAITKAPMPLQGLGLSLDGTVTWNGLPFEQASEAVRVRVSVAIGLALHPELRVILIRNGNDLGQKNLHAIAEMAQAADAQVWIERIAGGDGLHTVVIEDGQVQGAPPDEAPAPKKKAGPRRITNPADTRAAVAEVLEQQRATPDRSGVVYANVPVYHSADPNQPATIHRVPMAETLPPSAPITSQDFVDGLDTPPANNPIVSGLLPPTPPPAPTTRSGEFE